jgi:glyoxylase-like metal-dependent hydrolase (beta-lactamase superfamily II)
MRRVLHWIAFSLLAVAGLLALMLVLAGVSLRSKRHDAGSIAPVTSRVVSVRNFLSDVYAARVGNRIIVFDAGMDPDARALELLVGSLGADLGAVSDIFLTHGHFDHVAAATRCPGARIHIGAADADLLAQRTNTRALVPRFFGSLLEVPPIEASHRLTGSESIDVGNGQSVLALPLPGHTPGSYAYLFDGVLFTGDALHIDAGRLSLAQPIEALDRPGVCSGVERMNELFRRQLVSEICTGHRGCMPPQHTPSMLEQLSFLTVTACTG